MEQIGMKTQQLTLRKIKKFEIHLYEEEKSIATIKKYIRDLHKFYDFLSEGKSFGKCEIVEFKHKLQEQYKVTSINSILAAVNGYLDFLGLNSWKVKFLKQQKRLFSDQKKQLTVEEYNRLLKTAKMQHNERLCLLIQTICATGIRVSEHKFITKESLLKGKSVINNKGKIREIYFPSNLKKMLLAYCRKKRIQEGPVFITSSGKAIDRSNIWHEMKHLCEDADVEQSKVFPHNLRHLFACTFYHLEKDIVRLADILGHSSIDTTRIYTKTQGNECEKLLSKMNLVRLEL